MFNMLNANFIDSLLEWCKHTGTNILEAVAVLMVGIVIIKLARKLLRAIFGKSKIDGTATSFIISIVQALLALVVFFVTMDIVGVDTSSFVAILAASGLAVGLALQDSLSNISSGLILLATKPFSENDHVVIGSIEGKVKKIRITMTEILAFDNMVITVPNSVIAKSEIRNISAKPTRRLDIFVRASYESDSGKVKEVLNQMVKGNKLVLKNPAPSVIVWELNESAVKYRIRVWVKVEDYWDVHNAFMEKALLLLKENGMAVPYNTLNVYTMDKKEDDVNV